MAAATMAAASIRRGGPGMMRGNSTMTVGTQVSGGMTPWSTYHSHMVVNAIVKHTTTS